MKTPLWNPNRTAESGDSEGMTDYTVTEGKGGSTKTRTRASVMV